MGERDSLEKEKVVRIPWLYICLIVIATSIFTTTFSGFMGPSTIGFSLSFTLGDPNPSAGFLFGSMALMVVCFLICRVSPSLRRRLSQEKLAYYFAAVVVAVIFSNNRLWTPIECFWVMRMDPVYTNYLPEFWMPSNEVMKETVLGGAAVPWGAWVVPLTFWWVYCMSWFVFFASMYSIVRRQWLEVEAMPFPYAQIAHGMIVQSLDEKVDRRYLAAMLIGFLFYLPIVLRLFWSWFPDVYGFITAPWFDRGYLGRLHLVRWAPWMASALVGAATISLDPAWACLAYLMPVRTSFSMWASWIGVTYIGVQLAWLAGYYTGLEDPNFWSGTSRAARWFTEPPLQLVSLSAVGMIIGLTVSNIVLNRKYFLNTIRMAVKGAPREPDEAESYRMSYIMFLLSCIGITVVLVILEVPVMAALVLILATFFNNFGTARVHGLAMFLPDVIWYKHPAYFKWLYNPSITDTNVPKDVTLAYTFGATPASPMSDNGMPFGFGASVWLGDVFKVSQLSKSNNRNVFKIVMVSAAIAIFTAVSTVVWLWYSFGVTRLPFVDRGNWMLQARPSYHLNLPGKEPWLPWAVAGFFILLALSWLNARFFWFPIDPVGVILGTTWAVNYGLGFSALLGWIFKYITLKVGGASLYEKYGSPLAIGFVAGYLLCVFSGGIVAIYRFFHPF